MKFQEILRKLDINKKNKKILEIKNREIELRERR